VQASRGGRRLTGALSGRTAVGKCLEAVSRGFLSSAKFADDNSLGSGMAEQEGAANGGTTEPTNWATLKEGQAEVLHKPGEAFYNKAQVQNRDLSIAVIREFIKLRERDAKAKAESGKGGAAAAAAAAAAPEGIRILEGLSATGLRAVRYAKEIPGVREVVANDFSKAAVESIERNIAHNKVGDKVTASHGDASLIMYQNREPASARFDVVDLDPYGSATPFLDAAVQSVQEGGLLAVTCTDLAVLCGNHSEACHAKYGSTSLRGKHCHEMALRIVLSSIETHANRYKRHIVPLLCVHMDFYVRLFVRVYTSANEVKKSASKQSMVYQCTGCGDFHLQPLGKIVEKGNSVKYLPSNGPPVGEHCEHCGFKHQMGGAIWNPPIKNDSFVEAVKKQLFDSQSEFAGFKRVYGLATG
jgi:tRNA (guanine26-N2/guanine27-N2)-dimethyltransferase